MNTNKLSEQTIRAKAIGNTWPDGVPTRFVMNGARPVQLDVPSVRKLGANAMQLWQHLLDLRGHDARPRTVAYERLKADLGFSSVDAVGRAMARLKQAHLVDTWPARYSCDGWRMQLDVAVYGAITNEGTYDAMWVPEETIAWCKAQPGRGGARAGAGRYWKGCGKDSGLKLRGEPKIKTAVRAPKHVDQPDPKQALTNQNRGPKISPLTRGEQTSSSTKKKALPGSANFLPGSRGSRTSAPVIDLKSVPKVSLGGARLTGDPNDRPTRHQWVRLLVQAYLTAHCAVYGKPSRLRAPAPAEPEFGTWSPTTGYVPAPTRPDDDDGMARWPLYPKLEAAALLLHEHGYAPSEFATWALELAKGKSPRPRPITAVYSLKTLRQRADQPTRLGMYHQASSGNNGHALAPEWVHFEQMYRLREVSRRKRGMDHLYGFPPRYVAIREAEIKQGLTDPMACFVGTYQAPRKHGRWTPTSLYVN